MASLKLLVEGQYIRLILSSDFIVFSCILILNGGFDIWPVNTECLGMTLLFSTFFLSVLKF